MKPAALLATVFLSLVAVLHVLRLVFQVQFIVGDAAAGQSETTAR